MSAAAHKLTCFDCAQINRVPADKMTSGPRCGICGAPLLPAKPQDVTFDELEKLIRSDSLPLIVDIWAPWCGPCRMMAPEFEKAAAQLAGRARLVKLNSDREPTAAVRFSIRGIPALIRFDRGQETKRHAGAMSAAQIIDWVGA